MRPPHRIEQISKCDQEAPPFLSALAIMWDGLFLPCSSHLNQGLVSFAAKPETGGYLHIISFPKRVKAACGLTLLKIWAAWPLTLILSRISHYPVSQQMKVILFSPPPSKERITIETFWGEKRILCFGDCQPVLVRGHPRADPKGKTNQAVKNLLHSEPLKSRE